MCLKLFTLAQQFTTEQAQILKWPKNGVKLNQSDTFLNVLSDISAQGEALKANHLEASSV